MKGDIAGVAQFEISDGEADLLKLFVAPETIRCGVGRLLLGWACAAARNMGAGRMFIEADPAAAPFYRRLGAQDIGFAPSGSIPGRVLPKLVIELKTESIRMNHADSQITSRLTLAKRIALEAGALGLRYFGRLGELTVTSKGHQDMVSEADRDVETFLRGEIAKSFPEDGILGEEHGLSAGTSGYTWVLDPIDGTANFVNAIPAWSIVIACVTAEDTVLGVIHEPNANETFAASLGGGATVNGKPVRASSATSLSQGSVGVGLSNRVDWQPAVSFITDLMSNGGLFFRNASGAIMLAYVASGRLLGYVEEHMNAWDCAAGLLMVSEAGGRIHQTESTELLEKGGVIIAGGDGVFDAIDRMARKAFSLAAEPGLPRRS
jgi:myo-inositol-1(or 4)-monophosphatase